MLLEPLPYHRAVVAHLRREEVSLWDFCRSAARRAEQAESLRVSLLKSCYRLDAASQPDLHAAVGEAARVLGLNLEVQCWQSQNPIPVPNASIAFSPGSAHVVFSGPLLALLAPAELRAVLGHELGHYFLWQAEDGIYQTADGLLESVAGHPRSSSSHQQTARRWRLYTEIFCDRAAFAVAGDIEPAVAGLVKSTTGLANVSGASYVAQADELFGESGALQAQELTHPETFIRARALRLWRDQRSKAEAVIAAMIEGKPTFAEMDLVAQAELAGHTRRLIAQLLRPAWFQTAPALALARRFFEDFQPATQPDDGLVDVLRRDDEQLREYLGWVLLDFAAVDPDLEDQPVRLALDWAGRLELGAAFEKRLVKELGLKVREIKKLKGLGAESPGR